MAEFRCWLDPIIAQQAAHYGKTVEQFTELMDGAATHQELIETAVVQENGEDWNG
jgi:hypothetical protein